MNMVDQECDSRDGVRVDVFPVPFTLLPQLLVEFDEQQRLILHVREQIVLPDEVEHVRAPQAEEVRERLARLAVERVPEKQRVRSAGCERRGRRQSEDSQLREALHQKDRVGAAGLLGRRRRRAVELGLDEDDDGGYVVDALRPRLDRLQQRLHTPNAS